MVESFLVVDPPGNKMSDSSPRILFFLGGLGIFINSNGQVAQLVEQRTENPCVGGSIPSLSTKTTIVPPGVSGFQKSSDTFSFSPFGQWASLIRLRSGIFSFSSLHCLSLPPTCELCEGGWSDGSQRRHRDAVL